MNIIMNDNMDPGEDNNNRWDLNLLPFDVLVICGQVDNIESASALWDRERMEQSQYDHKSLSGRMDTGSLYQSTEDVLGIVRVDISGTSGLVAHEDQ